jgi:hypothetical protein
MLWRTFEGPRLGDLGGKFEQTRRRWALMQETGVGLPIVWCRTRQWDAWRWTMIIGILSIVRWPWRVPRVDSLPAARMVGPFLGGFFLALSACQCCIPTALAVPGPLRLTFAPKQKWKLLLILAVVLLAVEGLRYGILKKSLSSWSSRECHRQLLWWFPSMPATLSSALGWKLFCPCPPEVSWTFLLFLPPLIHPVARFDRFFPSLRLSFLGRPQWWCGGVRR